MKKEEIVEGFTYISGGYYYRIGKLVKSKLIEVDCDMNAEVLRKIGDNYVYFYTRNVDRIVYDYNNMYVDYWDDFEYDYRW